MQISPHRKACERSLVLGHPSKADTVTQQTMKMNVPTDLNPYTMLLGVLDCKKWNEHYYLRMKKWDINMSHTVCMTIIPGQSHYQKIMPSIFTSGHILKVLYIHICIMKKVILSFTIIPSTCSISEFSKSQDWVKIQFLLLRSIEKL